MRRPLVVSVAWLAAGQALIAALYWTFLHTPESNVWMLGASALLVLLMLMTASLAATGALDAWRPPAPIGRSAWRGLTHLPAFLVALAAGAAIWWLAARGDAWVAARSGEISAWFIATFDREDASMFFGGVQALVFWVQWVVAPVAALGVLAAILGGGPAALVRAPWVRRAFAPRRLALATLWVVVLVALPLQLLGWRMSGLPPTWVEPAVVGARLILVGLTATVGWALVCGTVTGGLSIRGSSEEKGLPLR